MAYRNRPIWIEDGAWVGAQAFVAPDVTVGCDAVITAGSIVNESLPAGMNLQREPPAGPCATAGRNRKIRRGAS